MMIYLYIKTHRSTGLKYLGMTTQDPFKYNGSGKHWQRHIRKHGYDIDTEILLLSDNKTEIKETGLFFSKLFNIVESDEWANLVPEEGEGGHNLKHLKRTPEWNRRVGLASKNRIPHNKNKKCWNNGKSNVWSVESPGQDFIEGIYRPLYKPKPTTGRKWYTNGKENCFVFEAPIGFHKGRSGLPESKTKGKKRQQKWWNNGEKSKLAIEKPGPDWNLGRLKWF